MFSAISGESAEFGPKELAESDKNLKDMEKDEYDAFKKRDAEKNIRKGYDGVKEKAKSIRQDYRAAVNKGTRSGSGKIVQENYDLLTDIWGRSPTTSNNSPSNMPWRNQSSIVFIRGLHCKLLLSPSSMQ